MSHLADHCSNVNSRAALYVLLAILVAAFGLRLVNLNAGLWLDEILTYTNYARMPVGQIISTYDSENQNLLYSILARVSFVVFGESAWALRLPAVLFGVGSIWALYLFGVQVSTQREALLSAALLAFSYHHLWFSQNARGYTGLLFWTLMASWLLVKAMDDARARLWVWYAIAAAMGVYTHVTMLFVVAGHFVIYAVGLVARRRKVWPKRWAGLLLGFCLAALLTLVLYAPVVSQMMNTIGGTEASVVAEWKSPLWTLLEIVRGLQIGFLGGAVVLLALALFGVGLLSYANTNPVVIGLLVISPLIGATVVLAIGHHLWPRFFLFAVGFGALVLVRGIVVVGQFLARLASIPGRAASWVGVALCVALITVSGVSTVYAYGPKQDYEGAMAFVEAARRPGDAVAVVGLAGHVYGTLYDVSWARPESVEDLNDIRQRSERTWLLYTFPPVLASLSPDIMSSVETDFRLVEMFPGTVSGGTIFVCRSD